MNPLEVRNVKEAEALAIKWAEKRYSKLLKVNFQKVWKEEEVWIIEGRATYRVGLIRNESKAFKLQLNAGNGEVIGYSE